MATARDRYMRKGYSEPLDKGRNAAAEADMAEAFEEPDWSSTDAGAAAMEMAEEGSCRFPDPGNVSYPGDSNDPGRYVPPVDDDGFQCGVCLLNRRQCMACARTEAKQEDTERSVTAQEAYWGIPDADRYWPDAKLGEV